MDQTSSCASKPQTEITWTFSFDDYPSIRSGEGVALDTSRLKSLWRWSVHLTVGLRGSRFRASSSGWKKNQIESTFFALGPHSFLGVTVTQLVDSKLLLHRRPHSLSIAFWLVVSLLFGVCNEKNYTSRNSLVGISHPWSLFSCF